MSSYSQVGYERRAACICGTPPEEHPAAEMLEDEPAVTLDDVLRLEGLPPLEPRMPEWPDDRPATITLLGNVLAAIAHAPRSQQRFTPHRQLEHDADGFLTEAELERLRRAARRRGSPYIDRGGTLWHA